MPPSATTGPSTSGVYHTIQYHTMQYHTIQSMLKTVRMNPGAFGFNEEQLRSYDKYIELLDGKVLMGEFFIVRIVYVRRYGMVWYGMVWYGMVQFVHLIP